MLTATRMPDDPRHRRSEPDGLRHRLWSGSATGYGRFCSDPMAYSCSHSGAYFRHDEPAHECDAVALEGYVLRVECNAMAAHVVEVDIPCGADREADGHSAVVFGPTPRTAGYGKPRFSYSLSNPGLDILAST